MAKDSEKSGKSEKNSSEPDPQGVVQVSESETYEKMLRNSAVNRYDLVLLARRWAYELKSEDDQSRSVQELIIQAMQDVLSGKVSAKTIEQLPPLSTVKKHKSSPISILDNIGKSAPESPAPGAPEKSKSSNSGKKKDSA